MVISSAQSFESPSTVIVALVIQRARSEARNAITSAAVAPMTRILGLLFGIVGCRIGRRSLELEEIVRARSVQSNTAVDDQLRAGNVTRILREQELCCPGHFVGCAEPLQERLGGKGFFKPFQLVNGYADFL